MKFVKTEDGHIFPLRDKSIKDYLYQENGEFKSSKIIKRADTIEELCDDFVLVAPYRFRKPKTATQLEKDLEEMKFFYTDEDDKVYGAIWVEGEHGEPILKAVTKPMNKEGEFELL